MRDDYSGDSQVFGFCDVKLSLRAEKQMLQNMGKSCYQFSFWSLIPDLRNEGLKQVCIVVELLFFVDVLIVLPLAASLKNHLLIDVL
jgi:hypothetical protein